MEPAESSGASTPPEREPVMDCCLVLTTLSGVMFNVSLSIAKFDRFADLEDHVMDYLVSVTDLKVFGCSIEFLVAACCLAMQRTDVQNQIGWSFPMGANQMPGSSYTQPAKGVTGSVWAVAFVTPQGKLTMLPTKPRSTSSNHSTRY